MAPQACSSALSYSSIHNSKAKNLPPPPGFSTKQKKHSGSDSKAVSENYAALKERRGWDQAISPAKQLPMQAIMLYMSGSSIQIFSMGIVFMLLTSPLKSVMSLESAFAPFTPTDKKDSAAAMKLILMKIVYVVCNVVTLGLGLWKCQQMGLLPTGTGDWLAFETRGAPPEFVLT